MTVRVGIRANWRAVAGWLALPVGIAILLWWMAWLMVQTACVAAAGGSVRA